MANIKLGIPIIATIQKVGNKSKEEGIAFASKVDDITPASEFISALIKNVFKFDVFSHFDSIDDLDMNPTYRFVRQIFESQDNFVKQSNNLARHLYDQSNHPNISNGEFYIIYIKGCIINGETVDALLLLKTEAKDSFLTISYENGEYSIKPQLGLSTRHVDKGCLIFNLEKESGYLMSIVETSTIRQDGRYWSSNFLYVKDIISDFQHTENIANFCASIVQTISKQKPEKTLELAKASRIIAQKLQENGTKINATELISSLGIDDEITSMLPTLKNEYENKVGKIPETFICTPNATKRKAITKSNILRVGSGFEVKILDSSATIEQGFDVEKKKNYLKLYYS